MNAFYVLLQKKQYTSMSTETVKYREKSSLPPVSLPTSETHTALLQEQSMNSEVDGTSAQTHIPTYLISASSWSVDSPPSPSYGCYILSGVLQQAVGKVLQSVNLKVPHVKALKNHPGTVCSYLILLDLLHNLLVQRKGTTGLVSPVNSCAYTTILSSGNYPCIADCTRTRIVWGLPGGPVVRTLHFHC